MVTYASHLGREPTWEPTFHVYPEPPPSPAHFLESLLAHDSIQIYYQGGWWTAVVAEILELEGDIVFKVGLRIPAPMAKTLHKRKCHCSQVNLTCLYVEETRTITVSKECVRPLWFFKGEGQSEEPWRIEGLRAPPHPRKPGRPVKGAAYWNPLDGSWCHASDATLGPNHHAPAAPANIAGSSRSSDVHAAMTAGPVAAASEVSHSQQI